LVYLRCFTRTARNIEEILDIFRRRSYSLEGS
jgi:hypothetical protein